MVVTILYLTMNIFKRKFYTQKLSAKQRIGPHHIQVLSVLVGNLLGDGHAEKRNNSTRFQIHMSSKNAEYVFWLHKLFAENGYCSSTKPVVKRQIGKNNKVYFSIKFRTFSFSSLNFLYDCFYIEGKKTVPTNIENLLTEQALAIWVMDDGGKSGSGMKISTESFSLQENLFLQKVFKQKFGIEPTIQRHKEKNILYFKKGDCIRLCMLIKPHTLPCMYYKLNFE